MSESIDDYFSGKVMSDEKKAELQNERKYPKPKGIFDDTKSLSELWKEPLPEIEFYIHDIIQKGMITAFYGPGKQYKSSLALHFALCIATGKDSFYYKTDEQCNVLWIDEEMGEDGLHIKTKQLGIGLGITTDELKDKFLFSTIKGFNIVNHCAELTEYINEHNIGMLFLDSMSKMIDGDENSSRDVVKVANTLRKITEETGVGILFVHHTPKGNSRTMRGSGDFLNQVDSAFSIERVGKNKYKLEQEAIRYGEGIESINFIVEDTDDSGMKLKYAGLAVENAENAKEARKNNTKSIITAWIVDNPREQYNLGEEMENFKRITGAGRDAIKDVIYRDKNSLDANGFIKYNRGKILVLNQESRLERPSTVEK